MTTRSEHEGAGDAPVLTPEDVRSARSECVYSILRAVREVPEPTSGVRVGLLSYNETAAYDAIIAILNGAVAAEREACARIADWNNAYEPAQREGFGLGGWQAAASKIARAIRQRAEAASAARATESDEVPS